jgi:hypothetical protein
MRKKICRRDGSSMLQSIVYISMQSHEDLERGRRGPQTGPVVSARIPASPRGTDGPQPPRLRSLDSLDTFLANMTEHRRGHLHPSPCNTGPVRGHWRLQSRSTRDFYCASAATLAFTAAAELEFGASSRNF